MDRAWFGNLGILSAACVLLVAGFPACRSTSGAHGRTQPASDDDMIAVIRGVAAVCEQVRAGKPVLYPQFYHVPPPSYSGSLLTMEQATEEARKRGVADEMISDMRSASAAGRAIPDPAALGNWFYITDAETMNELFSRYPDMWQGIREKFPDAGGVLYLSQPVFDRSRAVAVVWALYKWASPVQQYEWLIVFRREGTAWRPAALVTISEPWKG